MSERAQVLIGAKDETAAAWASAQANASRAINGIKDLIPGLAGALSAAGLIAFAKQTIDAADHLNDLSKSTGVSVENLAGLKLLARQTGTDLDGLAKGINRMSVEIGKDPEKFRALGVTATNNVEAFRQLADIFNKLPDIQQRNALAQAVFQKSWAELAPALSEGGQKIGEVIEQGSRASGMTAELARKADELNDKWAALFRTGGIGTSVLKQIIEPLTSVTDQMIAASKASDGLFESLARFTALQTGGGANDPAKAIGAINAELDELRQTLTSNTHSVTDISGFYDTFDAGIPARIALLERQRETLQQLLSVRQNAIAIDPFNASARSGDSTADVSARAAAFLADKNAKEAAMKKQWEMTHLLIDAQVDWNNQVKDHIEIVHRLEDAQLAASVAHLEQQQRDETEAQAAFVAMQQRAYDQGLAERNQLIDATQFENEQYAERLANLNAYLSTVRATTANALALRQTLETRHQQTLLQIELNKNAAVRSMQLATWSAAGDLVQAFAGKSQAAAIAVIAISKGLAIAQTIQSTAVATMRAFADLGPIAGAAAAAQIQALGAVQIGLIAATGLVQAAQVGSGGASLGSPANPVSTTGSGLDVPFAASPAAAPPAPQTTVIQFNGTTDERKLLQKFVALLNENSRDGGRIITA